LLYSVLISKNDSSHTITGNWSKMKDLLYKTTASL
jgi:hypothetical protein